MIRGILLTVLALLSTATPATSAPASPYVVYEIVRVKPGGPAEVPIKVETKSRQGRGLFAMVHLVPDDEDGGYRYSEAGLATLSADSRWRTYGWPVAPPACPAGPACGSADDGWTIGSLREIKAGPRDRILVGGVRGLLKVTVYPTQWRVRQTTLGMRAVYAEAADATGIGVGGFNVEHFRSAKAPSGKYGSMAFAEAPCDNGAGTATFASADDTTRESWICGPVFAAWGFGETREGGDWSLSGNVVGTYYSPLRLMVIDYPKR